nr:D-alanyl-D-alanine carboxypeptidase/D-alanyl-D-alanine-endopeptidase [Shewanella salipaludis]
MASACILGWALSSGWASAGSTPDLSRLLSAINPPQSQTALLVRPMAAGHSEAILSQNADTLLLPASTQKLLTAVASMAQLGRNFRFQTQIYADALPRKGILEGNLYISFSGDPSLTREDLRLLLKQVTGPRSQTPTPALAPALTPALKRIQGNIYLVGSKQAQLQAPGWVWDDLGICFAAPVSSFIIDKNCIQGQLQPSHGGGQTGSPASLPSRVRFADYLPVRISSDAVFDTQARRPFCNLALQRLANNSYHIGGCHKGRQPLPLAIAVTDPGVFAQETLLQLSQAQGLSLSGQLGLLQRLPNDVSLLASHSSAPLPELLDTMLLDSDNLIADSLLKQLGESVYHQAGNFDNGVAAMRKILTALGIDLSGAQLVDGSGLSRYNLLSASQLAAVLGLMYTDARFKDLLDSLPVAGVSGTLRYGRHYTRAPLKQHVIAKTGSMQGVANLAGFVRLGANRDYLVVVLENGLSPQAKQQQQAPFGALFLQGLIDSLEHDDGHDRRLGKVEAERPGKAQDKQLGQPAAE